MKSDNFCAAPPEQATKLKVLGRGCMNVQEQILSEVDDERFMLNWRFYAMHIRDNRGDVRK